MKVRAIQEGLAVIATVAAVLPKDTLVAITGNRTVDKAGAGAVGIGRLSVPAREAGKQGTVETRCKEFIEIKFGVALAAGARVKLGAPDGATGENTVVAWAAADGADTLLGIVWNGASAGAVGEILTY